VPGSHFVALGHRRPYKRTSQIALRRLSQTDSQILSAGLRGHEQAAGNSRSIKKDISMTQKGPPPVMYDRPSVDLEPLFSAAGHLAGIDPMLLKAIAMRESSLNPGNWTPATGAVGLMSLESQNWRSLGVTDPWDPAQNIMGGALLLGDNLKMYDGDLNKALQQYNGGNPSRWGAATQSYVQTVRDNYKKLTGQQAPDVLPQFIHPIPPPVLRPGPDATPASPVHLNMNAGPSGPPSSRP